MAHMESIIAASKRHPLVPLGEGKLYKYGTAGFRMKADLLEAVAFRVGLVSTLRSRELGGLTIGVMVTASHNPAVDNGVKIIDPLGEMLEQEWEEYATSLVNCRTDEELARRYHSIAVSRRADLGAPSKVIYARDTRPSGHTLVTALADALAATNTEYVDYKILTTPQLHYLTRASNTEGTPLAGSPGDQVYDKVSETGYYEMLSDAFVRAMKGRKASGTLTVDCANGVGGPKLKELLSYIPDGLIDVKVANDDVLRPEVLNLECGADFVKTRQRAPPSPKPQPGARCCSLDGDADRLIYYWQDPEAGFSMLDGDRISTLAASFISELIRDANLTDEIRVGVVQTAYANGASTSYLKEHLRLPVICTPTGVKHLHQAAKSYDIGAYFEANGHGTVIFARTAYRAFKRTTPQSPAQKDALETLLALADLINQTVGDALSDMLMVEVILAHRGWTLRDWAMTYADLPNRLVRVEVADKDMFHTYDAERRLSYPPGAQEEIDKEVRKFTNARSFARASGTENACRVYAEAATRSEANELAERVARIVQQFGSK